MQIETSVPRDVEDRLADQVAVVEGEENVGRELADALDPERVVDVVGGEYG